MFSGKIFRSRWAALLWSAGILWTAYDIASAAPPAKHHAQHKAVTATASADPSDAGVSQQDLAILRQYAGG